MVDGVVTAIDCDTLVILFCPLHLLVVVNLFLWNKATNDPIEGRAIDDVEVIAIPLKKKKLGMREV